MKLRKPRAAQPGDINYAAFDKFTLAHFAIGVTYALLDFQFWLVVALAVGWEIIENPLKAHWPSLFPHGTADSWANLIVDTLAVLAGWALVDSVLS